MSRLQMRGLVAVRVAVRVVWPLCLSSCCFYMDLYRHAMRVVYHQQPSTRVDMSMRAAICTIGTAEQSQATPGLVYMRRLISGVVSGPVSGYVSGAF